MWNICVLNIRVVYFILLPAEFSRVQTTWFHSIILCINWLYTFQYEFGCDEACVIALMSVWLTGRTMLIVQLNGQKLSSIN